MSLQEQFEKETGMSLECSDSTSMQSMLCIERNYYKAYSQWLEERMKWEDIDWLQRYENEVNYIADFISADNLEAVSRHAYDWILKKIKQKYFTIHGE